LQNQLEPQAGHVRSGIRFCRPGEFDIATAGRRRQKRTDSIAAAAAFPKEIR
jgi:hypothetical protein